MPALGDTARCKNCPETITYLWGWRTEEQGWFHTRDADGRTMQLKHCPRPRTPSTAEPEE